MKIWRLPAVFRKVPERAEESNDRLKVDPRLMLAAGSTLVFVSFLNCCEVT